MLTFDFRLLASGTVKEKKSQREAIQLVIMLQDTQGINLPLTG